MTFRPGEIVTINNEPRTGYILNYNYGEQCVIENIRGDYRCVLRNLKTGKEVFHQTKNWTYDWIDALELSSVSPLELAKLRVKNA